MAAGGLARWASQRSLSAGKAGSAPGRLKMKWNSLEEEPCSVARTVSVIGDRWTLLVLRDCFLRVRRCEDFQASLGVTRDVLADRLRKLVRHAVLRRVPYQARPKRYEYILTQKGLDLYPIVMAIVHWGDVHMAGKKGRPVLHQHANCGQTFDPVMTCSACGEPVNPRHVHVHRGPGAADPRHLPSPAMAAAAGRGPARPSRIRHRKSRAST